MDHKIALHSQYWISLPSSLFHLSSPTRDHVVFAHPLPPGIFHHETVQLEVSGVEVLHIGSHLLQRPSGLDPEQLFESRSWIQRQSGRIVVLHHVRKGPHKIAYQTLHVDGDLEEGWKGILPVDEEILLFDSVRRAS